MTLGAERQPNVSVLPDYAPGLNVESEQDPERYLERYTVHIALGRVVDIPLENLSRGPEHASELRRAMVSQAVRQLQDEAVTALGLNHWKGEIRREVEAEELRQRRAILVAIREAVRIAGTTDKAALLIQDEIDALGVA